MSRSRPSIRRLLASAAAGGGLVAALLAAPPAASAVAPPFSADGADLRWCSEGPAPCIASVTGVTTPGGPSRIVERGDSDYEVLAFAFSAGGSRRLSFGVSKVGGGELGPESLDDRWSIAFDLGDALVPRITDGTAEGVQVTRTEYAPGRYRVEIVGSPTKTTTGCDPNPPYPCPEVAPTDPAEGQETIGSFQGTVHDYGEWSVVAQREAMYGLDYWSNIDFGSIPPQLAEYQRGLFSIELLLANPHRFVSGEAFRGHVELRLPNAYLRELLGIPAPAALDPSSFSADLSGRGRDSISITQEPGNDAMRIDVRGVTFPLVTTTRPARPGSFARSGSAAHTRGRLLTVEPDGLVSRVTGLRARRVASTRARLTYRAARSQGARVTGYAALCTRPGDRERASVRGRRSTRMVVGGLEPGRAYTCRVRATSKRGPGQWSVKAKVARRP